MKIITATIFFSILFTSLQAQKDFDYSDREEEEKKERTGYQVYLVEYLLNPVIGLGDLPANDYPAMNNEGYQFRLRYGFGKKKFSPIADLSYYFRKTANSASLNNAANIRSFGLGIGHDYNLVNKKHFFIKPMYLINFIWYKINFTENVVANNLDGILNSNYKEFTFKSFQVPLQIGLNTGFKFSYRGSDIGILIGGGYIYNYYNTNWKVGQENRISDNIDLSSFYLTAGLISNY